MRPPLLLANPWWARPFEIFSRAIGMPSRNEADPSVLLAIAVPLLFGYMFGDVGQGAVLAVGGALLARRFPLARLFVAGGLSAIVFGVLFGSVFSMQGVIEPRWLEPLHAPLEVLVVPLYGGAVLLTLGLALAALESFWRGEARRWLGTDAGLGMAYLALMWSFVDARALIVAAAAVLWFCIGHGVVAGSMRAALLAPGELVERLLQLLINTLSFARVGAFALAHAGLSAAIVALVHASDHPLVAAAVIVAGNLLIIVLETLVVSIQTTRLVLFEFFTRFLVAEGRVFRPLPTPSALAQEVS
jgi:V/A-type H+-transporting ATPase subunit I